MTGEKSGSGRGVRGRWWGRVCSTLGIAAGAGLLVQCATPSHDDDWSLGMRAVDSTTTVTPTALQLGRLSTASAALVGSLRYTPLPHDHQQLIRTCAPTNCLEYGPETRALAVELLGTWTTAAHYDTERTVSVLKFFESGDYAPLGLSGVAQNAEYHVRLKHTAGTWTASLVDVSSASVVTTLDVTRDPFPNNPKPPPTVRFMRHENGDYALGVQCADGWCVLSKGPWNRPTTPIDCTGLPDTCRVPGFSDEQDLARFNGFIGIGKLERSGVVSRFYPIDTLARVTDPGLANGYKTVAFVKALSGNYKKGRVRFKPGSIAEVDLRYTGNQGGRSHYDMRIRYTNDDNAPDTATFVNIKVDVHSETFDIGTVRWAWEPKDEGLWVRCPAGCCRAKL